MVTLTPHPRSRQGDSSLLLDLELTTGSVPINGFTVELLFHHDELEIADVYMGEELALDGAKHLDKKIDNEHGQLLVSCMADVPYVVGHGGVVVATLCVRFHKDLLSPFTFGEKTKLFIHG